MAILKRFIVLIDNFCRGENNPTHLYFMLWVSIYGTILILLYVLFFSFLAFFKKKKRTTFSIQSISTFLCFGMHLVIPFGIIFFFTKSDLKINSIYYHGFLICYMFFVMFYFRYNLFVDKNSSVNSKYLFLGNEKKTKYLLKELEYVGIKRKMVMFGKKYLVLHLTTKKVPTYINISTGISNFSIFQEEIQQR